MHYILVIELESTGFTSCKIQGLKSDDQTTLEREVTLLNLTFSKQDTFFEIDTQGIAVLNMLSGCNYNYVVTSQSMTIEKSNIGGRTLQVQKIVWTLGKK